MSAVWLVVAMASAALLPYPLGRNIIHTSSF